MELLDAHFHNYCGYADRSFHFGRGLTVITGKNGGGKSTLLNGIFMAWTGSSLIEGKTRPKMLKWGTDRGWIESNAIFSGVQYKVKRNLHNGSARLEWMEGRTPKALTTTPEINALLEGLMKADPDTLALSSFMSQKGAMTLIFGSDMERQKEYSRLFKLAHLRKHRDTLKEIYNSIEVFPDFTAELGVLETRLEGVKLRQSGQEREKTLLEGQLAEKRPLYEKALHPGEMPTKSEMDMYAKFCRRNDLLDRVIPDLEKKLGAVSLPVRPEWNKDKELQDSNAEYLELSRRLRLALMMKCPECASDVSVSPETLAKMQADKKALTDKIDLLSKEWSKYKKDLEAYHQADKAYSQLTSQVNDVIAEVGRLSTMVEKFDEPAFQAKQKSSVRTPAQQAIVDEFKSLEGLLGNVNSELSSSRTSIELHEEQIAEKKGFMELRKLGEEQRESIEEIRRVIHVDCFPKEVISVYRPRLSKLVNKYLATFRQPFHVDIDAELATVCKFADNPNATVGDLSGGQAVLLMICFRLAILELLASSTNIIVLDEPTPHLDSDNRVILVEAFNKVKAYLAAHSIQMIVSTHELELLSMADNEIKVTG